MDDTTESIILEASASHMKQVQAWVWRFFGPRWFGTGNPDSMNVHIKKKRKTFLWKKTPRKGSVNKEVV